MPVSSRTSSTTLLCSKMAVWRTMRPYGSTTPLMPVLAARDERGHRMGRGPREPVARAEHVGEQRHRRADALLAREVLDADQVRRIAAE